MCVCARLCVCVCFGDFKWLLYAYRGTLSLPRATIVAKLGYPFISIYSNRESLGNPRESHEIYGKCSIIPRAIPTTHI